MICAVIAAAGSGLRLGLNKFKFEVELCGRPLVWYSLIAFEKAEGIDSTILVIPSRRIEEWNVDFLRRAGFSKLENVIPGEETRQGSVFAGLRAVDESADVVMIHDGARPLVESELIDRLCEIPDGFDGVVPGCPITDTVKEVEGSEVVRTLDREMLVAVQTPQAFRFGPIFDAHTTARDVGFEATDDAGLVEAQGGRIMVVKGSPRNIKITYPEDLRLAEWILARGSD